MNDYEDKKYFTNKKYIKKTLKKYGVAIIPNILDDNECNNLVNGIWDYFEHITQKWEQPINRNKQKSWKQIYNFFPIHSMLFQHFNIGHSQVCWDVRQNKKIIKIFSKLWDCKSEELLVSFDGLSFNIPPEITNRGWNRNNTWYHTDQSFHRNDFECVQSWVTGLDVNEGDATLAFIEKSNRYHKEFQDKFQIKIKKDWYKLTKEQEQFYIDKGCKYKKIKCPKGSLVLWDSRTIHCGTEALRERKNKNFRAIIYLCYKPRKLCLEKNIKKKIKAFNELRMTTHWPCKVLLFGKNPRTYGKELPEFTKIEKPKLNNLGYKLAGL